MEKGKSRAYQHKDERVRVAASMQKHASNTMVPSILEEGSLVNPLSSAKEEQVVR